MSGCSGTAPSSIAAPALKAPGIVARDDGRCGSAFGGATCDPNGPYGGCCSSYGFVLHLSYTLSFLERLSLLVDVWI